MIPFVRAFPLDPGGRFAVLHLASLRRAEGGRITSSVLVLNASDDEPPPPSLRERLRLLGAELRTVELPASGLPFHRKTLMAGIAEAWAAHRTLLWTDPDMLYPGTLPELNLPEGVALAARPVDIANIGSRRDESPDAFWTTLYAAYDVDASRTIPVLSAVDRVPLRGYLNACCLVVRPDRRILRSWSERFLALSGEEVWKPYFEKDKRYSVFFHQAVLSAVVAKELTSAEFRLLPPSINYPLHFHERHPDAPSLLDDLGLVRIGDAMEDWKNRIPMRNGFADWLESRGV